MKRLDALEALGRGIANVRGNVELVGVAAGGTLVLTAIVVLTLIPWIGFGEAELGGLYRLAVGQAQLSDFASLSQQTWSVFTDFWGFLLALSVGLTVASIVYSWYYGGILGVLVAGEAQSPPGSRRDADLFRTWSPRFFAGEAGRLVWRLLGYFTLWLTVLTLAATLFVLLAAAAVVVAGWSGGVAGLALGCGGALPLFFLFFAVLGAMSLGQVDLAATDGSVMAASRAGVRWLGRRLAATIALFALAVVAAFALGLFEAGVGMLFARAFAGSAKLASVAQLVLFVIELMLSAILNLVFVAAFVALVRGEQRLAVAEA